MAELIAPVDWRINVATPVDIVFNQVSSDGWIQDQLYNMKDYNGLVGHSIRVPALAYQVGIAANCFPAQLDDLVEAGLRHDVGKVGLPVEVLNKPEPLTWTERKIVESHVIRGFEIVRLKRPRIAHILVGHHRYQINSYPKDWNWNQYRGTDIPKLHTIMFIADQVDSLMDSTAERLYKKPWSAGKTRDYLRELVGQGKLIDVAISYKLKLKEEQLNLPF